MAKNTVGDWSTTAASNLDVGGINIAEACAPGNINDAIREMMAQIKAYQDQLDIDIGSDVQAWSALLDSISAGDVDATEFGYLNGLSANIQDQIDGIPAVLNENGFDTASTTQAASQASILSYFLGFTSTAGTITPGNLLTLPHGKSYTPRNVTFRLKCNDASGDAGYSEDDEIIIPPGFNGSSELNRGAGARVDATNVYVRFSPASGVFMYPHGTTGAITALDDGKWDFHVEARP